MIRVSKLADYSVIVLSGFPEEQGALMTASTLSEETRVPEPTVSKILKMLSAAKIVTSVRGKNGGYKLTKPVSELAVSDVIAAIDGPVSLTSCCEEPKEDGKICNMGMECPMRGCWSEVNDAVLAALQNVTLSDMIGKR